MIALYLLAAHLVGDFVLQTRWQAAGKLSDYNLRARHVAAYALPFVPIAVVYSPDWLYAAAFMLWLAVLHFATDSRRFTSTLGDWIGWYVGPTDARLGRLALNDERAVRDGTRIKITTTGQTGYALYEDEGDLVVLLDMTPNPWPPIAILIDQTLHVCQLAVLAGFLLS